MAVVELTLFGGFEARLADGRSIDLSGQKDRLLLAFLAMSPGTPHTRDKLANLLWSDRGDQQARDSLKHALTNLRQCLQPITPAPIVADRQSVKLDASQVTTDVVDFEKLMRDGSPAAIEQATSLYRGDLLDGMGSRDPALEEWLLAERQRLRQLLEDALGKQLVHAMATQARDLAATTARRLLALDPLRESACRALMQIHADRAELTQAARLYESLRDRLQRELGVKPEPETVRLYEALRNRRELPADRNGTAASGGTEAMADHQTAAGSEPFKPSIAVLPFENLSGDPDQQYFSDGITEDIITELSRFHSLFVIARNSSFAFKGKSIKVQDIANELGVAYIVEGRVRRESDRVRITAQLVDARTGNHLWAERYDRELRDIFALQDDVARSVASTVSGRLDKAGRDHVERLSPDGLRAYDLTLRAKALTLNYTRNDNQQALACAERAGELDPNSARALTHAAWCHFYNYMAWWSADRDAALAKSYELADRAVKLDETDSFARSILAIVHMFRREFDEARSEIERAVDLNPNDPVARRYYGMFLAATGDAIRGIEQIELGKRLNPFDTRWVPWDMGIVCFTARKYDEAIAVLKQVRDPINEVRGWLAASYAQSGRLREARAMLDEFLRVAAMDMATYPGDRLEDWKQFWHGAFEYRDEKDFEHLFDGLRKAGMPE